jgi:hypothetical protein
MEAIKHIFARASGWKVAPSTQCEHYVKVNNTSAQ